jgi:hypothetical protein
MSTLPSTRGGPYVIAEPVQDEDAPLESTRLLRLAAFIQRAGQGARAAGSWLLEDSMMKQQKLIGVIMFVALAAFELFNFDTTRFALDDLFGDTSFLTLPWATVLAAAFCGIDFAGLARLFVQGGEENRAMDLRHPETIYLWGAWFLAAGMNAVMTWWAVSLTLLQHDFGNEVLTRAQILRFVPIFVAVLVWLTRILLIGAFSVASSSFLRVWNERSRAAGAGGRPAVAQASQAAIAAPGRRAAIPGSLARVLGNLSDEAPAPVTARPAPPPQAPARAAAPQRAAPLPVARAAAELEDELEDDFVEDEAPRKAAPPPVAPAPRPVARPAPKPVPAAGVPRSGNGASAQSRPAFAPRPVPAYRGNGNGNGAGSVHSVPPPMPPEDDFTA